MKAIITLLGFAAAWESEFTLEDVREMDALPLFARWTDTFDRHYDNLVAEASHFMTFLDNLYIIAEVNSQDLSYKLALNQFSDMNSDEFRHYVHGDGGSCFRAEERQNLFIVGANENEAAQLSDTPDSVDWTTKGVVTPVKNQGQCGSCWAFSTTGSIECDYAIRSGTLNSLSEQQLVDCAGWSYGCQGCNGGEMMGAMRYVADDGGLCSESEYSYTARGGSCKSSSCGTKYNAIRGGEEVREYSSAALETATAAGCVSVAIEADQMAFQFYSSGVLTGTCGTNLDHGVLVVGYGTSGSQQYWKVKNSWGPSWGESGYVLICRNCNKNGKDGQCGILMQPCIPTF